MSSLLSRLFDFEKRPFGFAPGGRPFDLTGFVEWLAELGIDHSRLAFLHIAGTKGKGSTAAFCEALLRGLGYRTGMYSSPHLSHFGERIRIDGQPLPLEAFDGALERFVDALPAAHRRRLFDDPHWRTVFELLTALAMVEFERAGCDAIVWETGLGGRLDCTNAVNAAVSAITPIAFDHEAVLGNTIELIAREKAGIVKAGGIVVLGAQVPEHALTVRQVVETRAAAVGATLVFAEEAFEIREATQVAEGMRVTVRGTAKGLRLPAMEHTVLLPLHGAHQARNFQTALAAVDLFTGRTRRDGGVPMAALVAGVARTNWPGRLEVHPRGAATLVLDGAHCPLSAATLGQALAELRRLPHSPIRGEATLLLGMQRDKKHGDFLAPLAAAFPIARVIGFTVPGPRAASGEALAEAARTLGFASDCAATVEEALAKAPKDGTIVVTGSLYALADARHAWESRAVSR